MATDRNSWRRTTSDIIQDIRFRTQACCLRRSRLNAEARRRPKQSKNLETWGRRNLQRSDSPIANSRLHLWGNLLISLYKLQTRDMKKHWNTVKAHVQIIFLFTVNLFKAETRRAQDWTETRLHSRDGGKSKKTEETSHCTAQQINDYVNDTVKKNHRPTIEWYDSNENE